MIGQVRGFAWTLPIASVARIVKIIFLLRIVGDVVEARAERRG
jgi:preprotein translocase subunit SecD